MWDNYPQSWNFELDFQEVYPAKYTIPMTLSLLDIFVSDLIIWGGYIFFKCELLGGGILDIIKVCILVTVVLDNCFVYVWNKWFVVLQLRECSK